MELFLQVQRDQLPERGSIFSPCNSTRLRLRYRGTLSNALTCSELRALLYTAERHALHENRDPWTDTDFLLSHGISVPANHSRTEPSMLCKDSPANHEAEPHETANSHHLLPTNTAASGSSAPRFKSSSIGGRISSRCIRPLAAQLTPDLPQGLRCTMQHFIGLSRKLRPVFSRKGPLTHLLLYSGMHTEDTSWITLPVPSANIILFKY